MLEVCLRCNCGSIEKCIQFLLWNAINLYQQLENFIFQGLIILYFTYLKKPLTIIIKSHNLSLCFFLFPILIEQSQLLILFIQAFNSNMEDQNLQKHPSSKQTYNPVRNMLPPPNPIITKNIDFINQKVNFKVDYTKQTIEAEQYRMRLGRSQEVSNVESVENLKKSVNVPQTCQITSLLNQYDNQKQIFMKYNNEFHNKRGKKQYLASIFIPIQIKRLIILPQYKGTIKDDQLIFDSNFQSANLMTVFRTGQASYDLVLQNDINTSGFTQWFNFKVSNKRNNFIAKFSIVNLYKSKSLYNMGMKPIVHSEKSDKNNKKTWRRKGFNIFYEKIEISFEDNSRKYYKTLTFQYDFTTQNDTVQFAHAMPYEYQDLQKLLTSIKSNQKVSIKQIGVTILNKPINVIKIASYQANETIQKKAIIILARQHPGETPGSYIAEEIVNQLLRHSIEVDFLTWRFDIYVVPMVNIDGVILGNYRGNFAGFDLNRCWLKTDPNKQPQVFAIKNYIRKICKKQHVQLILDLHGHSRKMGSFFYGNNIGKTPMLFPYVASRANTNIIFDDCKFSTEKAAKASTARVVLGNLIKQTGNVYTYEVSFFGNYKNNQTSTFSFNEEHYRELGKALVLSMYRTYMEMYKEEKTLKESVFLKNIKKQIQEFSFTNAKDDSQSGSDSEAEEAMQEEKLQLEEYYKSNHHADSSKDVAKIIQDDISVIRIKNNSEYKLPVQKNNQQIKRKVSQMLQKHNGDDKRSNLGRKLPSIYEKQDNKEQKQSQKLDKSVQLQNQQQKIKKHGNRLKVYGQTFELRSRFHSKNESMTIQPTFDQHLKKRQYKKLTQNHKNESRQYLNKRKQLLKSFNTIAYNDKKQETSKELEQSESKIYRKYKNRNNSLTLKEVTPAFSDQLIHDVVKINKLDFQKIRQQQNQTKILVDQMQRSFKLPII